MFGGYLINDFLLSINENDISINYQKQYNQDFIANVSLKQYLKNIKAEIDKVHDKWDALKKYTNKYEFINTSVSSQVEPNIKASVCAYKPISRSFFKMIEILDNFEFSFGPNIESFHLAEGPGGFIEALAKRRTCQSDVYNAMTLMDSHNDIPKWNKINNLTCVKGTINLLSGPRGDGNLYLKHNLDYISEKFSNKIDFITADGGFDYSVDFNRQEENSINLIFCEVLYALIIQKEGGSFVLKIFDAFHRNTLEIIQLLCFFYKRVSIYKPLTSREANSEKYVICQNFQIPQNYHQILTKLKANFKDLRKEKLTRIFKHDMNVFYLNKIQEINAIFGQQQIENILSTMNHIHEYKKLETNEKLKKMKMNNIERCKKWCVDYREPIHKHFTNPI